MKQEKWMQDATCGSGRYDRNLWFPEPGDTEQIKRAKKVCTTECPVLSQCREYAVTFPAVITGVWGGLSRRQIREARVARGIAAQSESEMSDLPRDWGER